MDRYETLRTIGKGSIGEVYLVRDRKTRQIVTIKKSQLSFDAKQGMVSNEIDMLQQVSHPNVVSVINHFIDNDSFYIVLEYLPLGNLKDLLLHFQSNQEIIPESIIKHVLFDCLNGLSAIHKKQIIHRDIKPENLLIARDGSIKICDFTASVKLDGLHNTCVGTIQYIAPELLNRDYVTPSADIWSLGCVVYELMTRQPLFPNVAVENMIAHFIEQWNGEVELPSFYSYELREIVKEMLVVSPDHRPSVDSLLCRPYFQKKNDTSLTRYYAEQSVIHLELEQLDLSFVKKGNTSVYSKLRKDSSYLIKNGHAFLKILKELEKVYSCLLNKQSIVF